MEKPPRKSGSPSSSEGAGGWGSSSEGAGGWGSSSEAAGGWGWGFSYGGSQSSFPSSRSHGSFDSGMEAARRVSNILAKIVERPGWTVFRMLLPSYRIDMEQIIQDDLLEISQRTKAQIRLYYVHGVTVVSYEAIGDFVSASPPAARALVEVHRYFTDGERSYFHPYFPLGYTKLLVSPLQASFLLNHDILKSLQEKAQSPVLIYLTDILSILYPGDVIFEVKRHPEHQTKAIQLFASYMAKFTVDEDILSELEDRYTSVIRHDENVGDEGKFLKFDQLEARRITTVHHTQRMLMSDVSSIVGENGENIEFIQRTCAATIVIGPISKFEDKVVFVVEGGNGRDVEEAETLMAGFAGSPLFACVGRGECVSTREFVEPWKLFDCGINLKGGPFRTPFVLYDL